MTFQWSMIIDIGIISLALLVATLIRAKVRFFQRFLIPNALTAGFLLLPFYNYLGPLLGLSQQGLQNFVFHFLNISFIAMALRGAEKRTGARNVFATVTAILSQYGLQSILGFGLTFLLIATIFKGLFPTFGFFITLGFALGPGQAFSMGTGWEKHGFTGAGTVGLAFGAFGFVWAFIGGVILVNYALRKGWLCGETEQMLKSARLRRGVLPPTGPREQAAVLTTEEEAIDSLAYNLAVVLGIYLLTYLLLTLLGWLLSFAGGMGADLANSLWSIMFIFGALLGLLAKRIMKAARVDYTLDRGTLMRITGTSVDIMVAASVGAIAIAVVSMYWVPILLMGVLGGAVTLVTLLWISSRIFPDHHFPRFILIYGALTGTLPSGLALLRIVDPQFSTPASSDYVYASGVTFPLAIPLLLVVNLPAYGYAQSKPLFYWITVAVCFAYVVGTFIAFRHMAGKQAFGTPHALWRKQQQP